MGRGQKLGENDNIPFSEMTVEDLLEIVRRLPAEASAVKAIAQVGPPASAAAALPCRRQQQGRLLLLAAGVVTSPVSRHDCGLRAFLRHSGMWHLLNSGLPSA